MIFYRSYPCAPKATLISGFANIVGYLAAIMAIVMATQIPSKPIYLVPFILLTVIAAFLIIYVGRKLTDKLAGPETEKNIATKPRFAQAYCNYHPDEFERIAELNPEFAAKYEKTEDGRVIKRK